MRTTSGYLYAVIKDGDGLAVSYHNEQIPDYLAKGKVLIHLVKSDTKEPKLDASGQEIRVIKSLCKLKVIGYVD